MNRKQKLNKKFNELRQEFGGCCKRCKSLEKLQFAHIRPTGLSGRGRGKNKRYYDIVNNKDCYILLCYWCHQSLDNGAIQYDKDTQQFGAKEIEGGF